MAKKMNFTKDDINYPESYWRLGSYTLSPSNACGKLRFDVFKDKGERDAGKFPIDKASYDIFITPEIYAGYFAPTELNPEGQNPIRAAYIIAGNDEFFNNSEDV